MKFIEIIGADEKKRLINIDYVEEIVECDENSCYIYLAFNCPNAIEQDHFLVNLPYNEITKRIRLMVFV